MRSLRSSIKDLKLMEKREVGKQIGVVRFTRCGLLVRMNRVLHGIAQYTCFKWG